MPQGKNNLGQGKTIGNTSKYVENCCKQKSSEVPDTHWSL